jgi:DNA adenine methylase
VAVELVCGPVLRYHGGKYRSADWIISHFPKHRVYVEPYGGGASVLLSKQRSKMEIYAELDPEVCNVFRCLRDPETRDRLVELIVLTPFAREEFDLSYEPSDDPVEQARRTILRGFLGMSTRGTSGGHRTGFRYSDTAGSTAEKVWARYPERIAAFGSRLTGVVVENRPALEVIAKMDKTADGPRTLYYCDPPYVHSTRQAGSHWRRAYKHEMTDDDHRELAAVLHRVQGMVIVSGYASELYEELYGDWRRVESTARIEGAQARTECLWLCPRTSAAQQRLF